MKAILKDDKVYVGEMLNRVHNNHSIPLSVDEIREDCYKPYVVFESCTNYPFLHGVMAESEDSALSDVMDYCYDEDGEYPELIGVEILDF